MNAEMAGQIMELRHKGLGYKSIAIVVGTSRENVRYYCKTHGLDGYAEQVKMLYREQRNTPDNCKYCGKHLVRKPHSGKKLFCSDECRRRAGSIVATTAISWIGSGRMVIRTE